MPAAPEEAISPAAASVGEIATLEQEYIAKYGRYLQVMPGNTLASTESGSVQSKFGKPLPENIRIDVYESPHGKGYQIYYEENGVAHSVGYGPEAADRTFTIEFPKPVASATCRRRQFNKVGQGRNMSALHQKSSVKCSERVR